MDKKYQTIDSRAWTGEEDYIEVESLPVGIAIAGLLMLTISILL